MDARLNIGYCAAVTILFNVMCVDKKFWCLFGTGTYISGLQRSVLIYWLESRLAAVFW